MVQAGQNYAKLGGRYTKEVRFPHGRVSDISSNIVLNEHV